MSGVQACPQETVRLAFLVLCPQCRAYEKVYGRKAHEKIP